MATNAAVVAVKLDPATGAVVEGGWTRTGEEASSRDEAIEAARRAGYVVVLDGGDVSLVDDEDMGRVWTVTVAAAKPKNRAAAQLGRRGGRAKSEAKAKAVRANGAKGGRPALCEACGEPTERTSEPVTTGGWYGDHLIEWRDGQPQRAHSIHAACRATISEAAADSVHVFRDDFPHARLDEITEGDWLFAAWAIDCGRHGWRGDAWWYYEGETKRLAAEEA